MTKAHHTSLKSAGELALSRIYDLAQSKLKIYYSCVS